ncbi:MAG: hypothetical protein BGO67_01795 [Alphaproteobacteria bacterium 41-28]|nr:MAG: hypothetical protein BGO67_01795 [Alphaproteobacteria bacterium 41-28]
MFENLYFKNTLRFVVLVILFTIIGVMKGRAMDQVEVDDPDKLYLHNALFFYKNSIELGEDAEGKSLGQSQYYIGLEHLKENVERALEWFQKAADHGNTEAENLLKLLKKVKN